MNALTLRDLEAADRLALARLDDDGAPAAVTSVVSHGSAPAMAARNRAARRRRARSAPPLGGFSAVRESVGRLYGGQVVGQ